MNHLTRSIVGVVLILVIAFNASFVVGKTTEGSGGWDLTEYDLYTLTDGSKNIVDKLQQQLHLKLFYSREAVNRYGQDMLVQYNNYHEFVRDLLGEYARHSQGKLVFEEFDPRPYSDAEEEADRLGLRRFPLTEKESFVFGLAVTSETGVQETIPFFSPDIQPQIEYKISELLDVAGRTKKAKVGVLSSLSITGGGMTPYMRQMMQMQGQQPEQPWTVIEHLKTFYEIVDVDKAAEDIDPEIDYLLVVHPKVLGEPTLYAIDQFVMNGGKLLVFTDPHCYYGDQAPQDPQNPMGAMGHDKSSNLNRLLEKWGVTQEAEKFSGDLALGRVIQWQNRQTQRPERGVFPGLMVLGEDVLNQDEVVTQGLKDVEVTFAGALKKTADVGTTVTPLLTTTKEGNTWTASSWEFGSPMMGGPDLGAMAAKFTTGIDRVWIGAKISGTLPSAFDGPLEKPGEGGEDGENGEEPPAADSGEDAAKPAAEGGEDAAESAAEGGEDAAPEGPTHLAQSKEESVVIVVADVDMLTDNGAYQRSFLGMAPRNSNSSFLLNCLDYLAGSSDLISIRSRGVAQRPMTAVDEIERRADTATREKIARINDDKKKFEDELNNLRSQATTENVGLLENEAIKKQRELEAEIRRKDRELRDVQEAKLTEIEGLGNFWKNFNRFGVPAVVLLFGVLLAVSRYSQRQKSMSGGVAR